MTAFMVLYYSLTLLTTVIAGNVHFSTHV